MRRCVLGLATLAALALPATVDLERGVLSLE
jgi:hypothetical protein